MDCPKVIIDCDAGTDDALALALLIAAHKQQKVQIMAITCVYGNTYVDNVVENVFRTLQVCEALDIPVYKGANSPLLASHDYKIPDAYLFHGADGFGDVFKDKPDISNLQDEHAIFALQRITSQFRGQVSLLCLGPLTNLALTIKMYPDFVKNAKQFLVMGGNFSAVGNVTAHAEFNFYSDPESAYIFLINYPENLWILPWETCLKSTITTEWRDNVLGKISTPIMEFINFIDKGVFNCAEKILPIFEPCDALVAGILLTPELVTEYELHHVDVELTGMKTRGQVLIDHLKVNKPNAYVIKNLDFEAFKDLLIFAVNGNTENSKETCSL